MRTEEELRIPQDEREPFRLDRPGSDGRLRQLVRRTGALRRRILKRAMPQDDTAEMSW
jgi:hypothetical protein